MEPEYDMGDLCVLGDMKENLGLDELLRAVAEVPAFNAALAEKDGWDEETKLRSLGDPTKMALLGKHTEADSKVLGEMKARLGSEELLQALVAV